MHFRGPDGWEDVDDAIVADPGRPGGYRNRANRFTARFAAKPEVAVVAPEGTITMTPRGGQPSAAVVGSDQTVVYPEVWPGVDLRYRVFADEVKEEIVVRR
ncbi:MAG: hypothetical protein ACRDY7_15840, partial [Acidimicrobiia bacterium]